MNSDRPMTRKTVSDGGTAQLVPATWDLPSTFRQRLGDRIGRQRAMFADGHLLLVLHEIPDPDDLERRGRLFWRSPDGTWHADQGRNGAAALDQHLSDYRKRLEKLDESEHVAESAEDYFEILSEVAPLYRAARNQHLAIQEARTFCPDVREIINFRDRAYDLERAAELLHTDSQNALDFSIARRAEDQARAAYQMGVSSHRLNILVGFFFPIATLCAVFSTTLKTGLESLESRFAPAPFIIMVLAGLLIGVILKSVITREAPKPRD